MKNFILTNYDKWAYHEVSWKYVFWTPSFVHLFICLFVHMSILLFVRLFSCPFVHLSICPFAVCSFVLYRFLCERTCFDRKVKSTIKCKWKVNLKINWFDTIDVVRSSSYFDTFSNFLKSIGYIFNQLDTFLANG